MRLFIDIGNSEVKWASGDELARNIVHRVASTDLVAELIPHLQLLEPPSQVHIASVLQPGRTQSLCQWIETTWRISPRFAQTRETELGVVNGYRQPDQLGVDRWLGLLAAREISKQTLLVVDCGTATTLDAMDSDGRHLGGSILPGLQLFQRCLQSHTDIPEAAEGVAIEGFATDTAAGIASGAMLATTSAVEAMLSRLGQQYDSGTQCLLTGGFARQVARNLTVPHLLVPNLILQGLFLQAGLKDKQ
jgi:type III pantothenate kinase